MEAHLTSLCGSPLWNRSVVYQAQPDFTPCFQYTIVKWAPCLLLWIIAPFWIYMLSKDSDYLIKRSWILIAKTVSIIGLIAVEAFNLVIAHQEDRATVYFLTPWIMIATYILALFLIHFEQMRGLRSSTLIFVFWLFMALCSIITFRSQILAQFYQAEVSEPRDMILFFVFYGLVLINLAFSMFTEKALNIKQTPADEEEMFGFDNNKKHLKLMPENSVSLMSRLCFWWINDLILTGFKRPLVRDDMWRIEDTESSHYLTKRLETQWNKMSRKYIENLKNLGEESTDTTTKNSTNKKEAKAAEEQLRLTESTDVTFRGGKKIKKPSFALCLWKVFGGKFLAGSVMKVIHDCLLFMGPVLLDQLIKFFKDQNQSLYYGLFFTFLMFITSLVQSFVLQHYFHRMFIVGSRIRTSIINVVYKKGMRLSNSARKTTEVGAMTNIAAVNAQMLADLTTYLNIIWSAPFQIIVSVIMLWSYLGVSAIIGISTIVIFMPLSVLVGNKTKKIQLTKQSHTDSRIKMMNELLAGMKIIKFYGWELSFKDIIGKIRTKEMNYLKKMGILSISSTFLWICAPLIITIVSFGSFILLNGSDKFTPNVVFVSMSLFNIMRFPLTVLPGIISAIISAKVSLIRVSSFLLKEEINDNDISHEDIPNLAVKVSAADLGWNKQNIYFKSLNLEIPKGKLVAIVGPVGSGKSSMLAALLGEMYKFNFGLININGSTAYVPQIAWVQNETLRNNILFGSPYDETTYQKVLDSCSLLSDLAIMPAGDKTEIGEKGINLSGGQKQRISLARAVYSQADIYLLDDPLSAVDSHVGKHIFDNVIGPKGMLKRTTRIFVTNSLSFLPQVDDIIMLEGGQVKEVGTYEQLRNRGGLFTEFTKNYLAVSEANKQNYEQEEDEAEKNSLKEEKAAENSPKKVADQSDKSKSAAAATNEDGKKAGEKIVVQEKIESGKVKLSVITEYIKACRIDVVILYLVTFSVSNFASIGSNYWLSYWTDQTTKFARDDDKYFYYLVFVAISISQCILVLFSDFVYLIMYYFASKLLHNSMLHSLLRSTMEFFESTPSGRIINRFSKDVEATERGIPESFKSLIRCVYHVLFTFLVISFSTPLFLIVLVPLIIVYIFVQRYFVASMRQLKRMESASKSPIFSHFSESMNGVSTIKAYNAQNRFVKIMENHVDENLLFYFPNNVSNRWLALRLELIGNLVSVFAALFAVLSRSSISASLAGLSITYSLNVSQTLNWLVRMSADFETNITSVERIKEYCETPHEDPWQKEDNQPKPNWPDSGHISFRNYSVKYRQGLDNVLNQINVEILPSEKIGIVGRTGAGKSSLTLALFRILEHSQGNIIIDNVDIKQIGLHQLRHKITIIPQDPVIFTGTIRMNLDPFNIYTDDQIWKALELSHLKDFVLEKEKKLDFDCPQGGSNLSVGQRQLMCLARALLRKTKILVLDEATASIDHNTDELIQNTIRTEFKDCTVLTIAHRLNTIMDSSRILVLDHGKIVEFDKPSVLLKDRNSLFYSMAQHAGLV